MKEDPSVQMKSERPSERGCRGAFEQRTALEELEHESGNFAGSGAPHSNPEGSQMSARVRSGWSHCGGGDDITARAAHPL